MPKYWVKNYFAHGRFPEVGQKQKTEKKQRERGAKVGDNNGQATHGARKLAWRTQATWAIKHLPSFGWGCLNQLKSLEDFPSILKAYLIAYFVTIEAPLQSTPKNSSQNKVLPCTLHKANSPFHSLDL